MRDATVDALSRGSQVVGLLLNIGYTAGFGKNQLIESQLIQHTAVSGNKVPVCGLLVHVCLCPSQPCRLVRHSSADTCRSADPLLDFRV